MGVGEGFGMFQVQSIYFALFLFPGGSVGSLPALQETRVQSLGREDLLEKEMATHYSILALLLPIIFHKCSIKETCNLFIS